MTNLIILIIVSLAFSADANFKFNDTAKVATTASSIWTLMISSTACSISTNYSNGKISADSSNVVSSLVGFTTSDTISYGSTPSGSVASFTTDTKFTVGAAVGFTLKMACTSDVKSLNATLYAISLSAEAVFPSTTVTLTSGAGFISILSILAAMLLII